MRTSLRGPYRARAPEQRLESVRSTDPANPMAVGYGLGIAKFGHMYGHTGELPGFQSFADHDPDRAAAPAAR